MPQVIFCMTKSRVRLLHTIYCFLSFSHFLISKYIYIYIHLMVNQTGEENVLCYGFLVFDFAMRLANVFQLYIAELCALSGCESFLIRKENDIHTLRLANNISHSMSIRFFKCIRFRIQHTIIFYYNAFCVCVCNMAKWQKLLSS